MTRPVDDPPVPSAAAPDPSADPAPGGLVSDPRTERAARLAAALRANLRRRKAPVAARPDKPRN